MMHINYQYQLDWVRNEIGDNRNAPILDYGCGAGEVVLAGRNEGLNIFGADTYFDGGDSLNTVEGTGLLDSSISRIQNGRLDFPDDFFDLVMSNQVMEHVDALDPVLTEIHRTMKPGGKFLSILPTRETMPENHIGIPFTHWFSMENPMRRPYVHIMRLLGFGSYKEGLRISQWVTNQLDWLDRFTQYRSQADVTSHFKRYFIVTPYEENYIRFRLARTSIGYAMDFYKYPVLRKPTLYLFHRLAGMVIVCEKL